MENRFVMHALRKARMISLIDFVDSYPSVRNYELFWIRNENGSENLDLKNTIVGNRQELLKIPKFKNENWILIDSFESGYFIFSNGKIVQGFDKEKSCLTVFYYSEESLHPSKNKA